MNLTDTLRASIELETMRRKLEEAEREAFVLASKLDAVKQSYQQAACAISGYARDLEPYLYVDEGTRGLETVHSRMLEDSHLMQFGGVPEATK